MEAPGRRRVPTDLQTDAVDVGRPHDPNDGAQQGAHEGPVLGALCSGALFLVAAAHGGGEQGEALALGHLSSLVGRAFPTLLLITKTTHRWSRLLHSHAQSKTTQSIPIAL